MSAQASAPSWKQLKREARLKLFSKLGEAVGTGAKRAKLQFSLDPSQKDAVAIHQGARPTEIALNLARDIILAHELPGPMDFRVGGVQRRAGFGLHGIDEGRITIIGEVFLESGHREAFEVPVEIRERKAIMPSTMIVKGTPRIIAQSVFDEIAKEGRVAKPKTGRPHQFSPPPGASRGPGAKEKVSTSWKCASCGYGSFKDRDGAKMCAKCGWFKKEGSATPSQAGGAALATPFARTAIHSSDFDTEIESLAKDIWDDYMSNNDEPPSHSSEFDDNGAVSEAVDGHQWIIYTSNHEDVLSAAPSSCSDPDISGLVDGREAERDPEGFCAKVTQIRAYEAMRCAIFEKLQEMLDDYEPPEEEEEEEVLSTPPAVSSTPPVAAPAPVAPSGKDPVRLKKLQDAYTRGQQSPQGTPPKSISNDRTEQEAFSLGQADKYGFGFGAHNPRTRQVVDFDDDNHSVRVASKDRHHPWDDMYGGSWDACDNCGRDDHASNFPQPGLCNQCQDEGRKKKPQKDESAVGTKPKYRHPQASRAALRA